MNSRPVLGSLLVLGIVAVAAAVPLPLPDGRFFGRGGEAKPHAAKGHEAGPAPRERKEILVLERELPLAPGGPLTVDVHDADVSLRATEGERARVRVYAWSEDDDEEWARRVFERAEFRVEREAEGVRVTSREVRYDREDRRRHRGFGLRLEVEHPQAVDARIETEDGDVAATRIRGRVRLASADGDISAESLEGPVVELRTSDGDVHLGEATARSLGLVTSDGDIDVSRLTAEDVSLETSDGDVILREGRARRLRLASSDGDLVLTDLETEEARLETSEGDISVERLRGALRAVTSEGDIEVWLQAPAPLTLATTEGDISVRVPAGAGFELDLTGGSVRLGGDLRADRGASGPGRVRASVHGGGPRIEARASEGDVSLHAGGGR